MRRLTQSPAILLLVITCVLLDVITTAQDVEIDKTQCIQQRQIHPLNVSCVDICSALRCAYVVPHGLTELNDKDCHLVWHDQDGVIIADPAQPDKLYRPAVEVTPAHLITEGCVDGFWFEINCRSTEGACRVEYRVPDVAEYEEREAGMIQQRPEEISKETCFQQRQPHFTDVSCNYDYCSAQRCTYTVPHGLTEINDKDCHLVWYKDYILIADPAQPDKLYPPAVEVTPAHLITKGCVDGVWFKINCRSTQNACKVHYEVHRYFICGIGVGRFWTGVLALIIAGVFVVILCVVGVIWYKRRSLRKLADKGEEMMKVFHGELLQFQNELQHMMKYDSGKPMTADTHYTKAYESSEGEPNLTKSNEN